MLVTGVEASFVYLSGSLIQKEAEQEKQEEQGSETSLPLKKTSKSSSSSSRRNPVDHSISSAS